MAPVSEPQHLPPELEKQCDLVGSEANWRICCVSSSQSSTFSEPHFKLFACFNSFNPDYLEEWDPVINVHFTNEETEAQQSCVCLLKFPLKGWE